MSLTDGLPHIFRRRLLEKKVELLDELDAAPYTPPARNSFEEGSVLFEDTDGDFDGDSDATASRSLLGASTVSGATHSDVAQLTRKPTLFPPEPGLPAEAKDLKWLRILGSCIVVMSNGVQYSLSQFSPAVSEKLGPSTMASAISLLICFFTLGCIFHGTVLMTVLDVRQSVLLTSPLVFSLLLSNVALQTGTRWLMLLSFSLTGFGIGPSFLSAIIHMQFWLPKNPALASSVAMAFGGLGSVAMAILIEAAIDTRGVSFSFTLLAFTLAGLQVFGGLLLKMPDLSESHAKDLLVSHRSKLDASARFTKSKDTDAFRHGLGIELRPQEIVGSWQFALFWVSAFTAVGPGYALFANLTMVFKESLGMPHRVASTWVILVNLIATLLGRLPTGYVADRWNNSQRKLFGSGSRSMFLLFHCSQMAALAASAYIYRGHEYLALCLILVLTCIFGGCNVLIAALSRELFAPINSSAVYGLILTSTAASALVYPNLLPALHRITGEDFTYNIICSFASAAGTLCCLMLKPLPQAYGISTSLLDLNS